MTRSRPLRHMGLVGFVFFCGLEFGAASCSNDLQSFSSPKIYGGVKSERDDWLNTVALTDKKGIFCSATALTPHLVLTAAHCLEGTKVKKMGIYVGAGARDGDAQGQYRASRTGLSPEYRPDDEGSDHDIGYVVLNEPLDLPASAYVPVAAHPSEVANLVTLNQPVEIVGFGLRENQEFGHKHHAQTQIKGVTKTVATIGGDGIDACNGDSGGPAFGRLPNGEVRLFGVASNGEDCGLGGDWSLVHPDICWLMEDSGMDLGIAGIKCGGKNQGRD